MLNNFDDFPVHQTPEPLAQPATSDVNFYDRTWFAGYARDASYYFGVAMAVYPHLGILDCAFSVVRPGGLQHCFFASRRAPLERTEMQAGPMRIDVIEPMRRTLVTLDDNDSGLGCELMFSARTAALQEGRQTLWHGARRFMDATRFDQFGAWTGCVRTPDGEIDVNADACLGTKDRSWGVRPVGQPQVMGAPNMPSGFFFLWAPIVWDDHISQAIFFDGPRGEPLFREALSAPLFCLDGDIPDAANARFEKMASVVHRVDYHPNTRLAKRAELKFTDVSGGERDMRLEPLLRFHMKGLGYGHPMWRHGVWHDELALGHESFDPNQLDLLAIENNHVQQVVRADDGTRSGIGLLEQMVIGPYAPAGFGGFLDGCKD